MEAGVNAAVEISLYPLREDFKRIILAFIARLNERGELKIITNELSTQIFGDYDTIVTLLATELKQVFLNHKAVAVLKIIGRPGEI
jgi:uncharacterized protein YqgV (UPF0045/DUF77 family)